MRRYFLSLLALGLASIAGAQDCRITGPNPLPVSITGCTFSGSLPDNSTSYIQNTLSPTTTTQAFSVQVGTVTDSLSIPYVIGQCLQTDSQGKISGSGGACGTGTGGGGGSLVNLANQYSLPYYSAAGSSNTLSGTGPLTGGRCMETDANGIPTVAVAACGTGSGMSPGATYYINVTETLQDGATFYVSSGTVKNYLNIGGFSGSALSLSPGAPFLINHWIAGAPPSTFQMIGFDNTNAGDRRAGTSFYIGSTADIGHRLMLFASTGIEMNRKVTLSSAAIFNGEVTISTPVMLGGTEGVAGQMFTSGGQGVNPSWTTPIDALTNSSATATYAPRTELSSTYLTQSSATASYLQLTSATVTYAPRTENASTYLAQSSATATYLQKSSATATYLTMASAAATYMPTFTWPTCGGTDKLTAAGTTPTCAADQVGGGGGASSLAVTVGVARSSPTSDVMFNAPPFIGTVSGSTITVSVNYSSFTMQGQAPLLTQSSATATYLNIAQGLTQSSATATYVNVAQGLTQSSASVTYVNVAQGLTQSSATATYLQLTSATVTYAPRTENATTYLTQSSATATYLQLSSATVTYAPRTELSTTYLTQSSATATYLQSSSATLTYAPRTELSTTYLSQSSATATYLQQSSATLTYFNKANVIAAANFPALTGAVTTVAGSLATTYSGAIGTQVLPSTIAYTNSTGTWTAQQTFNNTVIVSTTIGLGGVTAVGTSGQFLTSQGAGSVPTWTTATGASLSSTQTFTGGNTFTSPSGVAVTFGVTASSVAVSSLTASGQIRSDTLIVNTALNLPNGTGVTVDATGEMAYDTTADQLVIYNGHSVDVIGTSTRCVSVNISSGAGFAGMNEPIWTVSPEASVTISSITAWSLPAGTTVLYQLDESRALFDTAGSNVFSVDYSTANYTGVTTLSFADSSIAAGATLVFNSPTSGASTGSPRSVFFTICYRKDRL